MSTSESENPAAWPRVERAARPAVLLPVLELIQAQRVLPIASALAAQNNGEVIVLGIVAINSDTSPAEGQRRAREYRGELQTIFEASDGAPVRTIVRVNHDLNDAIRLVAEETGASMIVLGWQEEVSAAERFFGPPIDGLFRDPPCDLVVAKLGVYTECQRILMPVRGGPHTALVADVTQAIAAATAATITVLYANEPRQQDNREARTSLNQFRSLPGVARWIERAMPVQQALAAEAPDHQMIVLGVTGRQTDPEAPIGPVAEYTLRHFPATVVLVRRKLPPAEERAQVLWQQQRDQSLVVNRWFAENTFSSSEFEEAQRLLALKQQQGLTISLALPALNEEATIGAIISSIKAALVDEVPLIDEIVVIDSRSTDRTVAIAAELGVPVHVHQDILPQYGSFQGKGEALWKSLYVLNGDIITWIDTDIRNMHPRFVFGILGPLLRDPKLMYCKGFYRRPLLDQEYLKASGGGRVTELTARPLLNLFYPELSGFVQPLAGEYAGRRSALEQAPFFTGYGVEIGLLIDLVERHGLRALAQVDLKQRIHRNQELPSLSHMAFAILQVVMQRVEQRSRLQIMDVVNQSMKLIHYAENDDFHLEVREVRDHERPPIIALPEYRARHRLGPAPARDEI
jgi:nucleotide-binding universal stress UspA family protein